MRSKLNSSRFNNNNKRTKFKKRICSPKNNNNFTIKGLWTINETKLKDLDEKSIFELHSKGFLQHIYMIAASIGNMNNLIHLKKIKDSA